MKLYCPDCGRLIRAEDVDLSTTVAKCRACDSVFNFRDAVRDEHRRGPAAKTAAATTAAPLLPTSARIRVEEFAGILRFRWRWFRGHHVALAFFCVAWDSFLVFWYSAALSSRDVPWLMVVFPIAHVAVGVGMTYAVLTGFFNRTTVEVGHNQLRVWHEPLPWTGNCTIPTGRIMQLHCEQKRANNRSGISPNSYELWATLSDGRKVRLAGDFTDIAEPRMLEARIERWLNIAPREVVGEYAA
jgi:hypothetical protein